MADESTTVKALPTMAELEGKVERLIAQVTSDVKASEKADAAFASAVKSGNVEQALELADARSTAKATAGKSASQLDTAKRAAASAKHAANADKIASIHDTMRDSREVQGYFSTLSEFGVTRVVVEASEDGKLLISSSGPKAPKRSSGGGGGNGRGQPVTVDGTEYASASAALHAFYPESGPLNRDSILSKLAGAGHTVS